MMRKWLPYLLGFTFHLVSMLLILKVIASGLDSPPEEFHLFLYHYSPLGLVMMGGIISLVIPHLIKSIQIPENERFRCFLFLMGITLAVVFSRELYRQHEYASFFEKDIASKRLATNLPYQQGESQNIFEDFPDPEIKFSSPDKKYVVKYDYESHVPYMVDRHTMLRAHRFNEGIFTWRPAQWSPDSKYLIYCEGGGGSSSPPVRLYCLKIKTGEK